MRPARRPSSRPAPVRGAALLFAAAVAATAPPAANAQFFGLHPDGGAAPAPPPEVGPPAGWSLRPDSGVVPAGGVAAPACGPGQPCGVEKTSWWDGLLPDDGGVPAPRPLYPPGGRQKESGGLLWPPFPRSTAPKAAWKTQFHHAHYWPHPYTCRDRAYVRALAARQIAAGRREHAALHGFHFDPAGHLLTGAGRDHLRTEVLAAAAAGTTTPIVVAAGEAPEVGAARLAAVRAAVEEMGAPQLIPAITLGVAPSVGRPAEEIDRLRRDELQSTPQPRVPVASVGGPAGLN